MGKLLQAVVLLETRRKDRIAHHIPTAAKCLGDVRWALASVGLKLPGTRPRPNNTALGNLERLAANPGAFGWQAAHHAPDGSMPEIYLAFWGDCGKLADGRIAGHIAIVSGGWLYANNRYKDGAYWHQRLKAAFVPV